MTLLDVDTVCSVYDRAAVPRGSKGFFANDPQISIQGDIKSIGATLYHALVLSGSGFEPSDYAHLRSLVEDSRLLRHAGVSDNGEFTDQLIYILETCLHETPGMRFRNCAVLQGELEKLLDWIHVYRFDDLDRSLAFVSQSTAGDRLRISMLSQSILGKREMDLHFHGGKVYLDSEEILSIEHLPLYRKNKSLQDLMTRYDELTTAYYALSDTMPAMDSSQEKQAAKLRLLKLDRERSELSARIQQIQRDMFALIFRLSSDRESGQPMSRRVKEAAALLLNGHFDEALSAVSDRSWRQRIQSAKSLREQLDQYVKAVYREVIGERRMLISILKTQGVTTASAAEITKIYDELVLLVEEEGVELDTLKDYAGFLSLQNDLSAAIRIAERTKELYLALPELPEAAYADLLELLSSLYLKQRRSADAVAAARECLARYQSLDRRSPDAFLDHISDACHALAACLEQAPFSGKEALQEAEQLHQKSLALCRRLARENPARYEPKLASRVSSYATFLLNAKKAYSAAEKKYKRAIEIYERLSEGSDIEHTYAAAYEHHNLASLYLERGNAWLDRAEHHARQALLLLREPAVHNPCRFEPILALVSSVLGTILMNSNQLSEATENLSRAVEILLPLARHDPAREPELALYCLNFGRLLSCLGRAEDALEVLHTSFILFCRLQEEDPKHYTYYFFVTCYTIAVLSAEQGNGEDAVAVLREIQSALRRQNEVGFTLLDEYRGNAKEMVSRIRTLMAADRDVEQLCDAILRLI